MDVWFGFKYVNFLRALSRPGASKRTARVAIERSECIARVAF